jgi:hypothetical protein
LPGSRAPHLWLTRNGERVSTIDLTGHYLLLAGPEGEAWMRAAAVATDEFGDLTLDAHRVGKDLRDDSHEFTRMFGVSNEGASLIRPDGFVAWRSVHAPADPAAALREALARSLGH